jgi:hypothetical protein
LKPPSPREAFLAEREKLKHVVSRPKTCPFNHIMKVVEPQVWYCPDPFCMALAVRIGFPGSYKFHHGINHLYFSHEEAKDYLDGKQSLVDLVETKLVEGEEE